MPPKRAKKNEPPPLPPLELAKLAVESLLDASRNYDEWTNGERDRATYAEDVKQKVGVQLLGDWRACRANVTVAFEAVRAQVEDLEEAIEMMRDERDDVRDEARAKARNDAQDILRCAEVWVGDDSATRDEVIDLLRRVHDELGRL